MENGGLDPNAFSLGGENAIPILIPILPPPPFIPPAAEKFE